MFLPSLTPQHVRDRMTKLWSYANKSWQDGYVAIHHAFMNEYDYLSHWQNDHNHRCVHETVATDSNGIHYCVECEEEFNARI